MPNSPITQTATIQLIREGDIDSGLNRLQQNGAFTERPEAFRQRIWNACKEGLEGDTEFTNSEYLPNKFVGFIAMDDLLIISLPKVYHLEKILQCSEDEQRQLCRRFFHFLKSYTQWSEAKGRKAARTINTFHQDLGHANTKRPASRLATAQRLIQDFQQHDLWHATEQVYKVHGKGTVSWSRTFSKTESMYSESGVFYPNPIHRHNRHHDNSLLRLIHHWVIQQVFRTYGWLLTDLSCPLPYIPRPAPILKMLHLARMQLRESFSDRDIRLWRGVVSYLDTDKKGNAHAIDVYGSCAFHVIFEEACRRVFEMREEPISSRYKKLNAKVHWQLTHPPQKHQNAGNRADIVLPLKTDSHIKIDLGSHRILVVDSKYYDILRLFHQSKGETELRYAPSLTDVRKQYFYAQLIRLEDEAIVTRNAFLFPSVDTAFGHAEAPSEPISKIGTVSFGLDDSSPVGTSITLLTISLHWLFTQYQSPNTPQIQAQLQKLWQSTSESQIPKGELP